jgi:hypothetical protein
MSEPTTGRVTDAEWDDAEWDGLVKILEDR